MTVLSRLREATIRWLLRGLKYKPGQVITQGRREYIVDACGAWRRLGRDR